MACGEPESGCLMSAQAAKRPRILILAQPSPNLSALLTRIKARELDVTLALTCDFAVALCVGNHFAAVVLDAALIRNDDWTVAKSLKLVQPSLPILLLDPRSTGRRASLPQDTDALASYDPSDVLLKLDQLLVDRTPI